MLAIIGSRQRARQSMKVSLPFFLALFIVIVHDFLMAWSIDSAVKQESGDHLLRGLLSSSPSTATQHRQQHHPPLVKDCYPRTFTNHNRILAMISSFNALSHFDALIRVSDGYVSMCESGWNVTIIISTTQPWSEQLERFYHYKTFCTRIRRSLSLRIMVYKPNIKFYLCAVHRKHIQEELNNFDLFIHQEDDMIVKLPHVAAYLHETWNLHELTARHQTTGTGSVSGTVSEMGYLETHLVGFQRFCRRWLTNADVHKTSFTRKTGLKDADVIGAEVMHEVPKFKHVCLAGQPYVQVTGNTHQAIFMLTRDQVLYLQDKCQFLNQTGANPEYMSSFSLYNDNGYMHTVGTQWVCNMNKIIPGESFVSFFVEHAYFSEETRPKEEERKKLAMKTMDEMLLVSPSQNGIPSCWVALLNASANAHAALIAATDLHPEPIDYFASFNTSWFNQKTIKSGNPKSEVFLVENGVKRSIPDTDTFEALNLSWSAITSLSIEEMELFPLGPGIPSVKTTATTKPA